MEDGHPTKGASNSWASLKTSLGVVSKGIQIDVRLEEAVEEHQPVGPASDQAVGHVGHGAEIRSDLHGQGNGNRLLYRGDQVEILCFDFPAVIVRIGGDVIDVQFQGVGPGVLHHFGVANPAALGWCR